MGMVMIIKEQDKKDKRVNNPKEEKFPTHEVQND